LIKFPDVPRSAALLLREQFDIHDSHQTGELEEDEALRLLEFRGETKTATELRKMVAGIDMDKNRKLAYLELCCSVFGKSWQTLHSPSGDPAQLTALHSLVCKGAAFLAAAQEKLSKLHGMTFEKSQEFQAAEEARVHAMMEQTHLEAVLEQNRHEAEEKEKKKEADIEQKLAQKGAKGAAAKFAFLAANSADATRENAARIRKDAEEKRLKKQAGEKAKKAEQEALTKQAELKKVEAETAENARLAAEEAKNLEEAEKQRALSEKAWKEKEEYERQKKIEEEVRQKKADELLAKQATARAKMAARADFFKQQMNK